MFGIIEHVKYVDGEHLVQDQILGKCRYACLGVNGKSMTTLNFSEL